MPFELLLKCTWTMIGPLLTHVILHLLMFAVPWNFEVDLYCSCIRIELRYLISLPMLLSALGKQMWFNFSFNPIIQQRSFFYTLSLLILIWEIQNRSRVSLSFLLLSLDFSNGLGLFECSHLFFHSCVLLNEFESNSIVLVWSFCVVWLGRVPQLRLPRAGEWDSTASCPTLNSANQVNFLSHEDPCLLPNYHHAPTICPVRKRRFLLTNILYTYLDHYICGSILLLSNY